jgi:hypothetical protein
MCASFPRAIQAHRVMNMQLALFIFTSLAFFKNPYFGSYMFPMPKVLKACCKYLPLSIMSAVPNCCYLASWLLVSAQIPNNRLYIHLCGPKPLLHEHHVPNLILAPHMSRLAGALPNSSFHVFPRPPNLIYQT